MSLYRKILKQALSLSWKNKYLWFFGLFAAILSGGEYEIVAKAIGISKTDSGYSLQDYIQTNIFSSQALTTLKSFIVNNPLDFTITLALVVILLALTLFLIWLMIVSQAAIVNNSANITNNKKHDFKDGTIKGIENFWPVLGFNLLIKAIVYLGIGLISAALYLGVKKLGLLGGNAFHLVAFVIILPCIIALSFIVKYAITFKVIKNLNFIEAIKRGWQLFKDNWIISLEMAFILFFISFLVTLVTIIFYYVLAVPSIFLAVLASYVAPATSFWLVIVFPRILYFFIIALVGAMLATFQVSAWTILFTELIGKGGAAKIVRVFNNLTNR